jgi:ATP-dependent Lhr-like helicase
VTATNDAFELLHHGVQQWLWQQRWPSLRDVQARAIPLVLARDHDVLISAPTAGGKTEAAFLPIVSDLAANPVGGVGCLCVSPLRALINDQARRLTSLCDAVGLRVQPWHGDVAAGRAEFWREPAAVLIITPESLEAMFIRRPADLQRVLTNLRYVCVDELHAFVGSVRGRQLQSLLHRVDVLLGRTTPRVALSATFGRIDLAERFLRPDGALPCVSVEGAQGGTELRLQVRAFVEREHGRDPHGEIAAHLFKVLRGASNLVFANQRQRVEWFSDALRDASERSGVPNEFFPHHGSLSRDQRMWLEERLRDSSLPTSAVCTSTLELGIDLGDVASVAQIGPPPTVASLKQRLGRSGRRPGQPQVLRQYVVVPEVDSASAPSDRLRLPLIQSIAAIELMREQLFEPPNLKGDLHCSTLVQQTLSVIAQRHGASARHLFRLLCVEGPFVDIDAQQYQTLLRGMADTAALEQLDDGTLVPGVEGERLLGGYDLYTAFAVPDEYRLMHNGRPLGSLPLSVPALPESLIIFGGRRWKIVSVDAPSRTLMLTPAPAGKPPRFGGTAMSVSWLIRDAMRGILAMDDVPPYLDPTAQSELLAARAEFRAMGLDTGRLYAERSATWIAAWTSDAALMALRLALQQRGVECAIEDAFVKVDHRSATDTLEVLQKLHDDGLPSMASLLGTAAFPPEQKFDPFVPESLLRESYGVRHLHREEAARAVSSVLASAAPSPAPGAS